MRMYQQDSETQWDFGLFLFPTPAYCERACQQVPTIDDNYYFRHEMTGMAQVEEQQVQTDIPSQNWSYPYVRSYSSGNESDSEKVNDMEPSSSQSSPCEGYYDGQDWSMGLKENFSQMVPVPHVPKVNGEIPSLDEATTDHQRLLDRLQVYDLVENKVQGDGNCQFRALSDQLYQTPEHHRFVRQQILDQLKSHAEVYEGYVPMAYCDYLEKLSRDGEWGDHVTLQAAADSYGVKVFVITSFKDTCYIEILPKIQKSNRVIFLSFWAEVHYNSIYPKGDFASLDSKKKRRWWQF